jgi:hypothetical protein
MSWPRISLGLLSASSGLDGHTQTAFWIFDHSFGQDRDSVHGIGDHPPDEIEVYSAAFAADAEPGGFRQEGENTDRASSGRPAAVAPSVAAITSPWAYQLDR